MIKVLVTVIIVLFFTAGYLPQVNNPLKEISSDKETKVSGVTSKEKKDLREKQKEREDDSIKAARPRILNLRADLVANETILSWTLKNGAGITSLSIEKIIDDEPQPVIILKLEGNQVLSPEYIEEDLLTEEDMKLEMIIYRISGTDSAGQTIIRRQIPVYPSRGLSFDLYQNFPNPFNPNTKIKFNIPAQQHVTLKVFNILGNQVATLVDEYKPGGTHEVEFNASGLTSGVYLYTLQVGEMTETKRMILMK